MRELVWKAGRYTMFDEVERPVAEVCKVKGGWSWYIAGQDVSGDVATCSEAMAAVEHALGVTAAAVRSTSK